MQTSSSSYWSGLRESLTGLAMDYARAKYVDVETAGDDRYMRDQADMRYSGGLTDERGINAGTLALVVLGVAVVGLGAYVALR